LAICQINLLQAVCFRRLEFASNLGHLCLGENGKILIPKKRSKNGELRAYLRRKSPGLSSQAGAFSSDYLMVYGAVATPLLRPAATAMARMVSVLLTEIGPVYRVEAVVGVVPLVV